MGMRWIVVSVCSLAVAGCSSTPNPIVDQAGVDPGKYNRDLADCTEKVRAMLFSPG
jgi:hypothetical protein